MWILWGFCLTLIYFIFGYIWVKISIAIIISLHIYFFLNINITLYRIQLEEGKKNFDYISLYILLLSTVKIFIYYITKYLTGYNKLYLFNLKFFLDSFNINKYIRIGFLAVISLMKILISIVLLPLILIRNFIFVLTCILIPSLLIVNTITFFLLYEILLLCYYIIKCMPLHQTVESISKEPKIVNLETLDGEIIENLLLYQTTLTDYRLKNYNTHKELIVPYSNVKRIYEDYEFELKQLDNVSEQKYLFPLENINLGIGEFLIRKFVDILARRVMYRVWYKKAKIYVKINNLNQAKVSLEKAVESINLISINSNKNKKIYYDFIFLLKNDEELSKFKNDSWFVELINQPYKECPIKKTIFSQHKSSN